MKRIFTSITVVLVSNFLCAGCCKHALGLRFGTDDGFGTETYQHGLSVNNRLNLIWASTTITKIT